MRFSKVILAVFCLALVPVIAGAAAINEVRVDQSSTDNDEYFELVGAPGEDLTGLTYIVIGDGTGGSGVIEAVVDLAGYSIPADGIFLAVESTFTLACADVPDYTGTLDFENSDNVTHMLVSNFTGAKGDDVDVDDDGNLDSPPWDAVVDCIALVETPASGELTYCGDSVGPDGTYAVAHAAVCEGYWVVATYDLCDTDTPGFSNVNACVVGVEESSFGSVKSMFR
jgi:hypothetical protein